jgi:GTPase involved in cell partitioning and DNA repair
VYLDELLEKIKFLNHKIEISKTRIDELLEKIKYLNRELEAFDENNYNYWSKELINATKILQELEKYFSKRNKKEKIKEITLYFNKNKGSN